jgi:uracil-DNA glycosylase
MLPPIPAPWQPLLAAAAARDSFRALDAFLDAEVAAGKEILPPRAEIYRALALTPPERVRVLLLGQDPYPTPGDAHGLAFSVGPGVRIPGSLRNVFKELRADVDFRVPNHGGLEEWAERGVLLLNTVLTLRAGEAFSHRGRGWEELTDAVIRAVDARPERVVFVFWGNAAKAKRALVTQPHHRVVECAHPSPLSARLFLGCRCFSKINAALAAAGLAPIDWAIADR